jgi:hypothetical protein
VRTPNVHIKFCVSESLYFVVCGPLVKHKKTLGGVKPKARAKSLVERGLLFELLKLTRVIPGWKMFAIDTLHLGINILVMEKKDWAIPGGSRSREGHVRIRREL